MKELKSLLSIGCILFTQACVFNCGDYLNDKIKPFEINGIVSKKTKSSIGCFGNIILKGKGDLDSINVCYCVVNSQDLWHNIKVGDSLLKEPAALKVKVYRNGILVNTYDYPCCDQ
jgi:hypothetical protein